MFSFKPYNGSMVGHGKERVFRSNLLTLAGVVWLTTVSAAMFRTILFWDVGQDARERHSPVEAQMGTAKAVAVDSAERMASANREGQTLCGILLVGVIGATGISILSRKSANSSPNA